MSIKVNTQSPQPIYEQIHGQIMLAVANDSFAPGDVLPSARRLASDLSVNLHTVSKAYTSLAERGIIKIDRQKGAVVSERPGDVKTVTPDMAEKLNLLAAEAICRGMDYMSFIGQCMQAFRVAKGEQTVTE